MVSYEIRSLFSSWSMIFSAISDRNRLLILIALLDSERNKGKTGGSLKFSQLKEITGLSKGELEYHLKVLSSNGLIENVPRGPYRITDEGRKTLERLGVTKELLTAYSKS